MSDHHGNTPAAWTAVVVALLGFVVGGVGLMLQPISMTIFWVGVAIVVVAGILFAVMSKLGLHGSDHDTGHYDSDPEAHSGSASSTTRRAT